uniref:4a-hydroxytetrahydrobiopterin dehydratase n=1 Tax=Paulinella chromatophora TaxID=39717 RepID=B1X5V8_PAUCH|nr:hypothetical protein PCC_0918 [Paulinella chromatophora]ACB43327.1 hypothetical protein PCC_0918 [Paulinella chromatophora]
MNQPWKKRQRPERLERRVEFTDYQATRDFLERLNELSEEKRCFPDISFGRTYVNLTLHVSNNNKDLNENDYNFTHEIDSLLK